MTMQKLVELDEFLKSNSGIKDDKKALEDFERKASTFSIDTTSDLEDVEFEDKPIQLDPLKKDIKEDFEIHYNVFVDNSASTWQFARRVTVIKPLNLRGTSNAVKYAEQNNLKIKGLGSRHSFSLAPATDNCYIVMDSTFTYDFSNHNEDIKKLDQTALNLMKDEYAKEEYFDAPGGMTIEMINNVLCPSDESLEPLHGKQRSMYNMGGGDVQTFAGAFSTGTHGSGGKYSAYHDTIRSILLVAAKGEIFRLEPRNGITDPAKHEAYYDKNPNLARPRLLQDNNLFYATLVNMGCFGIIYSVIMEVQPMKLLHQEVIYSESGWSSKFKQKFKKPVLPDPSVEDRYYYVQINPYKLNRNNCCSIIEKVIRPTLIPGSGKKVSNKKFWPTAFANSGFAASVIRHIANSGRFPKRRFIERALRAQNDHENAGGGYTDITYHVWNAGSGKLKSFGTAIEFAFPVDRIPGILDLLFAFLDHAGDRGLGFYFNAPIALRFVRSGKAFLAPNYEIGSEGKKISEWCYIEILRVNSKNAEDDKKELELYQHIQKMFASMGGRPHWGLNFNMDLSQEYLRTIYPKFDLWVKAYHKFNKTGVFENALTRSMKISPPQQQGVVA
jgi:hypothetical protein